MDPTPLGEAITDFSNFLLKYFVVLAAAGVLAMAFVELFKKIHDARTRFQARATTRWFTSSSPEAFGDLIHLAAGVPKDDALCYANTLCAADGSLPGVLWLPIKQRDAAFALELEKMMATFQDAVDLAVTSPSVYPDLFNFMTDGASVTDRTEWLKDASQAPGDPPPTADAMKVRAERYARLRQVSKRKLDAFQTFTSQRWVNKQQLWANVLGTFVLSIAFYAKGLMPGELPFAAAFSLLGGMLAPVAKDIVVALQQARQPRI